MEKRRMRGSVPPDIAAYAHHLSAPTFVMGVEASNALRNRKD
jgi:hypothetical protein